MFEVGSESHVMVTPVMAAVPRGLLRSPVANLAEQGSEIMAALTWRWLASDSEPTEKGAA